MAHEKQFCHVIENVFKAYVNVTCTMQKKRDVRGSFGKFLTWHHNSTMLSNSTFLETRIQRLLDGLIFVKNGLVVHVQRMLKMSRGLYTGRNFKQNTWKKRRKIGDLICDHDLTN